MQFLDEIHVQLISGKGGKGCVSFLREKYKPKGGPDGGDGGRGASISIQAKSSLRDLSHLSRKKIYRAEDGVSGKGKRQAGKQGKDMILFVPLGTQVILTKTQECVEDLCKNKQSILIVSGGKGGLGNVHFKHASRQSPNYAQPGLPGEEVSISLKLKLLADVGLVGFPNAGKSTLLSNMTNKHGRIASYPFSTLKPQVGIVESDKDSLEELNRIGYRRFYLADIPGILEQASEGVGLGLLFLRHIERVELIAYVLDIDVGNVQEQFKLLQQELHNHTPELLKKRSIVIINKIDVLGEDTAYIKAEIKQFRKSFPNSVVKKENIFIISAKEKIYLQELKERLFELLPPPSFAEQGFD